MPTRLIDTDALSNFHRGHAAVVAKMASCPPGDVAASAITLEERISGWYRKLRSAKSTDQLAEAYSRLVTVVEFFKIFPIVPYTKAMILRADGLLKMRLNIKGDDLRIAATALETGLIVATCNVKDFQRVPGLVVEDWSV